VLGEPAADHPADRARAEHDEPHATSVAAAGFVWKADPKAGQDKAMHS
jgi:hypothetical protein